MLINELSKLFVYVPLGYGQQFINNYAGKEEYKQKIAFVADTKQIFTNGVGFGVSSSAFAELMQTVQDNHDELDARITVLENSTAGEIAQELQEHEDRLNVLEGDENTEGSIKNAIKALQDLILGDSEHLQETLDTIAEIDQWIADHGQEYVDLVNDVSANTNAIEAEVQRATAAEEDLDARVTALEDISIWDIFGSGDSDTPEDTEDTVHANTADDISNIADPQSTDVVVDTQDAMSFFTDDANSGATFNNITIGQ